MISGDCFERIDPFGQFSKWDFRQKLKQYKFKKLYTFLESCLNKFYKDYKKNKDNDISYSEYRSLMLKKLVLQRIETGRLNPELEFFFICHNLGNDIMSRKQ